jgi:hypothetical protein
MYSTYLACEEVFLEAECKSSKDHGLQFQICANQYAIIIIIDIILGITY